ncbi:hypothetical protein QSH15_14400, partial [Proteus faecis]|nr:hypothetical protein [Proteus faecis]
NDGVSKANTAQTTANNANNNANGRVPNTRKVNGKQLNADITLTAGDVGASTPAQVNEAKTMATNAQNTANSAVTKADNAQRTANDGVSKANTAQTTANNANNNANGRVPNTRKVNGKQLNADITLNAGDVGALTPAQGDVRYAKIGKGIGAGVKLIYDGPGYNWNKKMSFGGNFSGAWLMTQVYDRVIPLFPILDFAYNTYVQTGYDSAIQYKIEKDGITVVAGQGAILKKVWVVGV